jgi:hypothetical protein
MNVTETFIKLTEYLIPYKEESRLEPYLPAGYKKDEAGNYYIIIGETKTMFTCHLDNYTTKLVKVNHVLFEDDKGRKKVKTDEKTPLGSDDKAGMVVMLYMIENKVPGCYYFFIGEEPAGFAGGCKGSGEIYKLKKEWFKQFDRCIAFDRHDYGSIITRQRGKDCCSKEFAEALATEFAANDLSFKADPTGRYTDSAVFMYTIPEVTNIACGGFHEHTVREMQNLDYLERVCQAAVNINWEKLPTVREAKEPVYVPYNWEKEKKPIATKKAEVPKKLKRDFKNRQKEKPNLGFLRYKTWRKKKGDELFETIKEYFVYYGFYLKYKSTPKIYIGEPEEKIVGVFDLDHSVQDLDIERLKLNAILKNGFTITVIDDEIFLKTEELKREKKEVKFLGLEDFENYMGISFAAKFYKYSEAFLEDLRNYSKRWGGSSYVPKYVVEDILRKYGNFTWEELYNDYDELFDKDDFIMTSWQIRL